MERLFVFVAEMAEATSEKAPITRSESFVLETLV